LSTQQDFNKGKRVGDYNEAYDYVKKIRTRFRDDERTYNAFLEIIDKYKKGHMTKFRHMTKKEANDQAIRQVYSVTAKLFKHHSDLLEEFAYFLPDNVTHNIRIITTKEDNGTETTHIEYVDV
jgi:paired amphipathic helix protein Sin3a